MTKKVKFILCLVILFLVFILIFIFAMKSEHKIITAENQFNISEVSKITFYNGDEKVILDKNDKEFAKVLYVFENKVINSNDAVHMGYKNYKIRLSNAFNYIDISPSFTDKSNDFAQIGKENKITGEYDYINISADDNEILFGCYESKSENSWTLVENE